MDLLPSLRERQNSRKTVCAALARNADNSVYAASGIVRSVMIEYLYKVKPVISIIITSYHICLVRSDQVRVCVALTISMARIITLLITMCFRATAGRGRGARHCTLQALVRSYVADLPRGFASYTRESNGTSVHSGHWSWRGSYLGTPGYYVH